MSRVLLFVQTGDARPKCAARYVTGRYSERFADAVRTVMRHLGNVNASKPILAAARADRWWLVECENADLGRMAITTQTEQFGRILASGGRRA